MTDVWPHGEARINNSFDKEARPYEAAEVVERAVEAAGQRQQGLARLPYNLLTNNCEHFATHIRNGWAFSEQVKFEKNVCFPNN